MSISRLSFYSSTETAVKQTLQPKVSMPVNQVQFKAASAINKADLEKAQKEAAKLREDLQKLLAQMTKLVADADKVLKDATRDEATAIARLDQAKKARADVETWWGKLKDHEKAEAGYRKMYSDKTREKETALRLAKERHEHCAKELAKAKEARKRLDGVKERVDSVGASIHLAHALTTYPDPDQIRKTMGRIKSKHKIS